MACKLLIEVHTHNHYHPHSVLQKDKTGKCWSCLGETVHEAVLPPASGRRRELSPWEWEHQGTWPSGRELSLTLPAQTALPPTKASLRSPPCQSLTLWVLLLGTVRSVCGSPCAGSIERQRDLYLA